MEQISLKGLQGVLNAHGVVLHALIATHPDREHLKMVFEGLMSRHIERTTDPAISAVLTAFEETFREVLRLPSFPKQPPTL